MIEQINPLNHAKRLAALHRAIQADEYAPETDPAVLGIVANRCVADAMIQARKQEGESDEG